MKQRWGVMAVVAGVTAIAVCFGARSIKSRSVEDPVLVWRNCKRGGGGYIVKVVPGEKWKAKVEPSSISQAPPF